MTAHAKTVETVTTMLRGALLAPDRPEAQNALILSARKLNGAKIDIHKLKFGLDTDNLGLVSQFQKTASIYHDQYIKAQARVDQLSKELFNVTRDQNEVKHYRDQFRAKAIQLEKANAEIERLKAQLEQAAKPRTPRTLTTTKWVTRMSYTVAEAIQAKANIDLAYHRGDIPDAMAAAKMKSHVTRRTVVATKRTR